ncbi:hypothetical protein TWF569_004417 [Orbilia oligospora]|nr:hypothetical protein TWF706_009884 [Orbilia oligospora]KAF3150878.1 hypothetical protein TWF569_004417 [Orbilia oligospora]
MSLSPSASQASQELAKKTHHLRYTTQQHIWPRLCLRALPQKKACQLITSVWNSHIQRQCKITKLPGPKSEHATIFDDVNRTLRPVRLVLAETRISTKWGLWTFDHAIDELIIANECLAPIPDTTVVIRQLEGNNDSQSFETSSLSEKHQPMEEDH